MSNQDTRFRRLSQALDYFFRQPELLRQALTHRSFGTPNNERFEFIGDSILNYTVARMLFDRFPKLSEGELSRLRANLVNQNTLAELATELKLGDYLYLGEGELKSGGYNRPSILADALEATFAAISFDADFMAAEQVVRRLYTERVAAIDPTKHAKDAKTRLQGSVAGTPLHAAALQHPVAKRRGARAELPRTVRPGRARHHHHRRGQQPSRCRAAGRRCGTVAA